MCVKWGRGEEVNKYTDRGVSAPPSKMFNLSLVASKSAAPFRSHLARLAVQENFDKRDNKKHR
jgi:hypothetical protein